MNWAFLRTRRVARYYLKTIANRALSPFRKTPLYDITQIERMQASSSLGFPNRQIALLICTQT